MELVFVGLVVLARVLLRRQEARREPARRRSKAPDERGAPRREARPAPACSALAAARGARRAERGRARRCSAADAVYVIGGAVVFAVVYALLSWLKYRAYMDARFDLGNMVQAVYNTAHGHFLEITTGDLKPRQMSRLGSHVDPILALFALPWLVWPSPVMLLVGAGGDRRHRRVAGLPAGHARHARPARRRPARRRLPALPGARLPRAQRVPPGRPGDAAAAVGVPVPGGGPLGGAPPSSSCSAAPARRTCRW